MSHVPLSEGASAQQPPIVVTTPPQLATLLGDLSSQPVVAVDTESNSLYAYQEQVCVIQFSVPRSDYLVDALAGLDLSPLAPFFADEGIQKVFHAAEYDVICLRRDFGFRFANLFDTMWAARILGWPRVGLGNILEATFGVHTNKRYQRYDWGRRPLEPQAVTYAGLDTHYLLTLCRLQTEALMHSGRWKEAQEVFGQVAVRKPSFQAFDPQGFWRIKGSYDLDRRERAILRELYIWRDREARHRNRPPFKVLNDRVLVALAQACPRSLDDLAGVGGLKSYHVRRYGKRILRAIKRGEQAKSPERSEPHPRRPAVEVARFQALRTWRKQVADERGVDADVILGNAVLRSLAEQNPQTLDDLAHIAGLGPWKRETYGAAIQKVLDRVD